MSNLTELQDVRWSEKIVCRRLLTHLAALSTTTTLRSRRTRESNIRWVAIPARRGTSPRAASAVGSLIRCVVFALHAHTLLNPISPFPHNLGDRRTRRPVRYRLRSCVPQLKKNMHIVAYTTHRTCPTSSQCSPYPRNMVSWPFSHYARTSGRATWAGSVHRHRRLRLYASTSASSFCRRYLPFCVTVLQRRWRRNS